jgi:hypothetical protein
MNTPKQVSKTLGIVAISITIVFALGLGTDPQWPIVSFAVCLIICLLVTALVYRGEREFWIGLWASLGSSTTGSAMFSLYASDRAERLANTVGSGYYIWGHLPALISLAFLVVSVIAWSIVVFLAKKYEELSIEEYFQD